MVTVTVRLDAAGTPWLAVIDPAVRLACPGARRGGAPARRRVARRGDADVPRPRRPAARVPPLPAGSRAVPERAVWFARWRLGRRRGPRHRERRLRGDRRPGARGALASVLDKATGREVLTGPGNELVLQEEYEQAPALGRGPVAPVAQGPGARGVGRRGDGARAALPRRLAPCRGLRARRPDGHGGDAAVGRRGPGGVPHPRVGVDRQGPAAAGALPRRSAGRPAGVPDGDGGDRTAVRRARGRHRGALVDAGQPGQPLVRRRFGRAGGAASSGQPAPGGDLSVGARGGRGHHSRYRRQPNPGRLIRDLLVSLARAGVTATCSRAVGTRYGSVDVDSNLPDFRIALGGPSENAFTAEVLAAGDPRGGQAAGRSWSPTAGAARLWVPAAQSRAAAFAPGADLRGPRDLPVLIVGHRRTPAALDAGGPRAAAGPAGAAGCPPEVADVGALAPGTPRWRTGRSRCSTGARRAASSRRTGRCGCRCSAPARAGRAGCGSTATGGPCPTGHLRLAALVAHVLLRAGVDRRAARLARGRVQRAPPRTTTTT